MKPLVICGIGTGVGKTLISAIVASALDGTYWKPVQTGKKKDRDQIQKWAPHLTCIKERYCFQTPASPRYASLVENVTMSGSDFSLPNADPLIIELVGGALVPINEHELLIDPFIKQECLFAVVSRNYLGSINHTLLTIEALQARGANLLGLFFTGTDRHGSQEILLKKSQLPLLGAVRYHHFITKKTIRRYQKLCKLQPLSGILSL